MEYRQQSNCQAAVTMADRDRDDNETSPPGIVVSKFDYSVENHFKAMDKIAMLSGESESEYEQTEIQRLSSLVTFLRKWKDFCYQPRAIRFACESETPQRKDVTARMSLPQFSSAAVPKDLSNENDISSSPLSKDSVMYVGGHVWALDWCPKVHQSSAFDVNVEFIAISAHPPESSYHKIGAPLTGRGLIQIWCLLKAVVKDQDVIPLVKVKPRKYTRNNEATNHKENQPKKPRGRPRKNPLSKSVHNTDDSNQFMQDPTVKFPENSQVTLQLVDNEETDKNFRSCKPQKPRGRPRKIPMKESVNNFDVSNKHMQSLPECPDNLPETGTSFLGTLEKACKEDTCREQNAPGECSSINCNLTKQEKPKGRPIKRSKKSIDNLDGSNPYPQPLTVEFPQHSPKLLSVDKVSLFTPEIVAKEDNCRNPDGFGAGSDAEILNLSEPCEPRKKPTEDAIDNSDCNNQDSLALAVKVHKDPSQIVPEGGISHVQVTRRNSNRKRKGYNKEYSENSLWTCSKSRLAKCETRIKSKVNGADLPNLSQNCECSLQEDPLRLGENVANPAASETVDKSGSISENVALPRLVIGLAHNGKVAWDVKWRPSDSHPVSKHRLGYLAVLLGNGALEVWEVPVPCVTKAIFSCQKEGTDPRFVKLKPIFICSMLKCGDRQSIPLTLEWSASAPHDLILAGCHDGVVALWKFTASGSSKDTRPLLCFNADTVPIRALKWAPVASDPESANIIVTAGHKGVKFWDIRDLFHPLWDIPAQKIIYSLDWLPDPSCVVLSFDDGEIRTISVLKAASDIPVTGMPCVKTQQHGSQSYYCSSSSIWSVQVSTLTGMVAYCRSDGKVVHFQLTRKAVEKDPYRNREPHYLCGSVAAEEDDSTLTVLSPLPNVPFPMKKSLNEWGDTPRSKRGFLSILNQDKRAKDQISKYQTLEKQPSESTLNETSKSKSSQELACIDNDDKTKEENVKEEEKQTFPPKMVAMHRVRWNMNKGSERWLCYGGAAGIVRCQEIN